MKREAKKPDIKREDVFISGFLYKDDWRSLASVICYRPGYRRSLPGYGQAESRTIR